MNKMAILKVALGTVGAALSLVAGVMSDGKQQKGDEKTEATKEN